MKIKIPVLIFCLTSGLLTGIPSYSAARNAPVQPNCSFLSSWLAARKNEAQAAVDNVAQAQKNERLTRNQTAEAIFHLYLEGKMSGRMLAQCLQGQSDRENFFFSVSDAFTKHTFRALEKAQSPALRALFAEVRRIFGPRGIPLVKLTGSHQPEATGRPYQAGFHRGSGSIYLDIDQIAPSEWLMVFVHELLHAVDENIPLAMQAYKDETVPKLLASKPSATDPVSFSAAEFAQVETWLGAGLGRGLWAEYRAWVPSLIIYQQGRAENLWGPISWLEEIVALKADQPVENFLYKFLDDRSSSPTDGIFSIPLVQNALILFRKKTRETGPLPDLGNLRSIR